MIDDVTVYYYNSSAEQEAVVPEWLNHPEGIEFWQEVNRNLKCNRFVMDTAVRVTSEHYNHSHGRTKYVCRDSATELKA